MAAATAERKHPNKSLVVLRQGKSGGGRGRGEGVWPDFFRDQSAVTGKQMSWCRSGVATHTWHAAITETRAGRWRLGNSIDVHSFSFINHLRTLRDVFEAKREIQKYRERERESPGEQRQPQKAVHQPLTAKAEDLNSGRRRGERGGKEKDTRRRRQRKQQQLGFKRALITSGKERHSGTAAAAPDGFSFHSIDRFTPLEDIPKAGETVRCQQTWQHHCSRALKKKKPRRV